MLTNNLKKGAVVKLRNGWEARIEDNKKGNVRMATVYGYETEMGSIYAHDIALAREGSLWVPVEHTKDQISLRKTLKALSM